MKTGRIFQKLTGFEITIWNESFKVRIRDPRYDTNLFKSGFVTYESIRIHGFAKQIHVFTNLLYESRILINLSSILLYFVLDDNFFYLNYKNWQKLPIKNVLNFLRQKIPPGFDRFIILEIILENYFSVPIFSLFRTMTKISD